MKVEAKLESIGLELPPPLKPPPGIGFPGAPVDLVVKVIVVAG